MWAIEPYSVTKCGLQMTYLPWLTTTELNSKTSTWPPRHLCDLLHHPITPAHISSPTTLPSSQSTLQIWQTGPITGLCGYRCFVLKLPCVLPIAPSLPGLCSIHHLIREALSTTLPKGTHFCPSLTPPHVLFVFAAHNIILLSDLSPH